MVVKQNVTMNFVGTDIEVVTQADFCHALKFMALKDTANRIVGIAHHKHARMRLNGSFKGVKIDGVMAIRLLGERHLMGVQANIARGA